MEIPLPQSNTNDVYSLGFDRSLNRELAQSSTDVVYDAVGEASNAAQVLSGGNLNLKTLSIGGLVKQVAPGDDIQAAIDAVSREGGGTVQLLAKTYLYHQNIVLKDKVQLVGAGKDVTVIDFDNGLFGVIADSIENFGIAELNLENTSTNLIDFDGCNSFSIKNLIVAGGVIGIEVTNSNDFTITGCLVQDSSSHGVTVDTCYDFVVSTSQSNSNGGAGFYLNGNDGSNGQENLVFSCYANGNTGDGFNLSDTSYINLFACRASENTESGFKVANGTVRSQLVSCSATDNTGRGFYTPDDDTITGVNVIGFFADDNTAGDYQYEHPKSSTQLISPRRGGFLDPFNPKSERLVRIVTNQTGGAIPVGAVVIRYNTTDPSNTITYTNTNGDNKVYGVIIDETDAMQAKTAMIHDNGYTSQLLVRNGTSSIAIGDFLSTSSHAFYAKEATTGETAFAIALSAPTTSTAQIEAVLISPRLI